VYILSVWRQRGSCIDHTIQTIEGKEPVSQLSPLVRLSKVQANKNLRVSVPGGKRSQVIGLAVLAGQVLPDDLDQPGLS